MFNEFNFVKDRVFGKYFGFTDDEVKMLCQKNQNISFEKIEIHIDVIYVLSY